MYKKNQTNNIYHHKTNTIIRDVV